MKTFKTADMQRQGKVILDTAKTEGPIRIVRGKDIFVLTYEPQEDGDQEVQQVSQSVSPGILEEMLQVQKNILEELRRGQGHQVVTEDTCLPEDEDEPEEPEKPQRVVIPSQVPQQSLEPREPTDAEMAYAMDYYGLRLDPSTRQPELVQKGIESAGGTLKKMMRQGHDEALRVGQLPEDDAERYLFLLAVQLDKYEKALAKCRTGEPEWIPGAPR